MKKQILKSALIAVAGVGLTISSASATTFTFNDTWFDWPDYLSQAPGEDVYGGAPTVKNIKADVNIASGILNSVTITFEGWYSRIKYDTLFINTSYATDKSWDDWKFIIRDGEPGSSSQFGLIGNGAWEVTSPDSYQYILTDPSKAGSYRNNTPTGIETRFLDQSSLPYTIQENTTAKTLTYVFTNGLSIGNGFYLAYGPYCGNDVAGGGSPIPEPTTMLLMGTGLLGLAGISRRRKN